MSLRLSKTEGEPAPVSVWRLPRALLREKGRAALEAAEPIVSGEITD